MGGWPGRRGGTLIDLHIVKQRTKILSRHSRISNCGPCPSQAGFRTHISWNFIGAGKVSPSGGQGQDLIRRVHLHILVTSRRSWTLDIPRVQQKPSQPKSSRSITSSLAQVRQPVEMRTCTFRAMQAVILSVLYPQKTHNTSPALVGRKPFRHFKRHGCTCRVRPWHNMWGFLTIRALIQSTMTYGWINRFLAAQFAHEQFT